MTVILGSLKGFGRFWYGFVIGDDWTVAATVAAGASLRRVGRCASQPS